MTNILDTVEQDKARLNELIGCYWDIAFKEGKTGKHFSIEANANLYAIRQTVKSLIKKARREALLEAAEWFDSREFVEGTGFRTITAYAEDELRRMAEREK